MIPKATLFRPASFRIALWLACIACGPAHAGPPADTPPWLIDPGFTPGYNAPSNDDIFDEHLLAEDLVKDKNYLATTVNLVLHQALKKYRQQDDSSAVTEPTLDLNADEPTSYGLRLSSDKLMFKAKYRF